MTKVANAERTHGYAAERHDTTYEKLAYAKTGRATDATRATIRHAETEALRAAGDQQEILRQASEKSVGTSRILVDLMAEQTRQNRHAVGAIGRAVNWSDIGEIQRDFLSSSFARMSQINLRYREIFEHGLKSMSLAARH
jgi:hypothetical protein